MKNLNHKPLKNLQDLADFLRSMDDSREADIGFDMLRESDFRDRSGHSCGSACCIGGWVKLLNYPEESGIKIGEAVHSLAPEISLAECHDLCWPNEDSPAWEATPEQAARAVEILAETGHCDWAAAMAG